MTTSNIERNLSMLTQHTNPRTIRFLVVHCTATHPQAPISGIQASWRSLGWKHPGYHYLIDAWGNVHQLSKEGVPTNGVKYYNQRSIHVAYIGGINWSTKQPLDTRTAAQKATLLQLLTALKGHYPQALILGHRDFSPDLDGNGVITPREWMKACPSFDARREYAAIG